MTWMSDGGEDLETEDEASESSTSHHTSTHLTSQTHHQVTVNPKKKHIVSPNKNQDTHQMILKCRR